MTPSGSDRSISHVSLPSCCPERGEPLTRRDIGGNVTGGGQPGLIDRGATPYPGCQRLPRPTGQLRTLNGQQVTSAHAGSPLSIARSGVYDYEIIGILREYDMNSKGFEVSGMVGTADLQKEMIYKILH